MHYVFGLEKSHLHIARQIHFRYKTDFRVSRFSVLRCFFDFRDGFIYINDFCYFYLFLRWKHAFFGVVVDCYFYLWCSKHIWKHRRRGKTLKYHHTSIYFKHASVLTSFRKFVEFIVFHFLFIVIFLPSVSVRCSFGRFYSFIRTILSWELHWNGKWL